MQIRFEKISQGLLIFVVKMKKANFFEPRQNRLVSECQMFKKAKRSRFQMSEVGKYSVDILGIFFKL